MTEKDVERGQIWEATQGGPFKGGLHVVVRKFDEELSEETWEVTVLYGLESGQVEERYTRVLTSGGHQGWRRREDLEA